MSVANVNAAMKKTIAGAWRVYAAGTAIRSAYPDGADYKLADATSYANAATLARMIEAHDDLVHALRVIAESSWPQSCPAKWAEMISAALAKAQG
jgi:hypothetical protein